MRNTFSAFAAAIITVLLVYFCSGCGAIKNVRKNSEKTKTDSVATTRTETDVTETEERLTVTTIEADTTVKVKGSTVTGSSAIDQLIQKPLVLDDRNQTVTVSLDAAGKLNVSGVVKDRDAQIRVKKRVEEKVVSDRNTSSKQDSKVVEKKNIAVQNESKDVKRGSFQWWWLIIAILAIIAYKYLERVLSRL